MIFEELTKQLRMPVLFTDYSTRLSIHEGIKAQLYVLAYRLHYIPVLEANINHAGRTRIDCLFTKNKLPICGIEIDYSIKRNSIKKLNELGQGVEKIIISYGSRASHLRSMYRHGNEARNIGIFALQWHKEVLPPK